MELAVSLETLGQSFYKVKVYCCKISCEWISALLSYVWSKWGCFFWTTLYSCHCQNIATMPQRRRNTNLNVVRMEVGDVDLHTKSILLVDQLRHGEIIVGRLVRGQTDLLVHQRHVRVPEEELRLRLRLSVKVTVKVRVRIVVKVKVRVKVMLRVMVRIRNSFLRLPTQKPSKTSNCGELMDIACNYC